MAVNYVSADVLVSKNSAALTGAFDLFNSGTSEAAFLIRFTNDSNVDVFISYDGVTEHDYLVAGTRLELNFQTNAPPASKVVLFKKGQKVWLKGGAGTGIIYMAVYYAKP